MTYLVSGPAHLPYLIVSLHSLRRYYDGQVYVVAWPESFPYVEQIANDRRLNVSITPWVPDYRRKNAQFLCKIKVVQSFTGYDRVLYLDADTLLNRSPESLLQACPDNGMLLTQFNHWTTTQRVISKRLSRLINRESVNQHWLQHCLEARLPSVNGGVFAADPESPLLQEWFDLTKANRDIFIADETCLHVIMASCLGTMDAGRAGLIDIQRSGNWNASPKYFEGASPHLWHFHGDANVRIQKSLRGFNLWWPEWQRCVESNVGNVKDWLPQVLPTNKYLYALENYVPPFDVETDTTDSEENPRYRVIDRVLENVAEFNAEEEAIECRNVCQELLGGTTRPSPETVEPDTVPPRDALPEV